MTNETALVQRNWVDSFPMLILIRSFSLGKGVHVLILAAVGAIATTAGWRIAERFLSQEYRAATAIVDADAARFSTWPAHRIPPTSPVTGQTIAPQLWSATGPPPEHPLVAIPYRMTIPMIRFFGIPHRGHALMYYAAGMVWTLITWSFFGAAICRMAAMKYTRDERVELAHAVQFARQRLGSYLGTYCIPLFVVAALAIPVALLGLIMRYDFGVILGGIAWFAVIGIAFLMVLLLIGLLLGWPLMWAAIACEGTDAFDVMSRGIAYVFQKPFRYLGYIVFVAIVGTVGWLVVWGVSEGLIKMAEWSMSLGAGRDRAQAITQVAMGAPADHWTVTTGASIIGFWNGTIRTFAAAFAYSFFFTALTGIYLVLRRDVDHVELDQVYVEPSAGVPFGLTDGRDGTGQEIPHPSVYQESQEAAP